MIFEVEIGGRIRRIAVERTGRPGRLRVTVDGEAELVDVVRTPDCGLSLIVPASSRVTDLHLTPGPGPGESLVNLEGRTIAVRVNGRRTGHAAEAGALAHGEVAIVAPMPGRVVRVLVAPGDAVSARQGVVVVEAMKMENELRAPRAGRVKDVTAAAGMPVDAGRVLAVIE
jgi:biotin carboxyl carrier protein